MVTLSSSSNSQGRFVRMLVLSVSVMSMILITGCISSAKVYNNDKTVVYNGAMYNMKDIKQVNAKISGKLTDTKTVDLRGADKKQIEAYLKEYKSIYVRMAFDLDDQEMLYRASSVEKYNDYSKMKSSFEKAGNEIAKLLADKKKLQLKLK